MGLGKRFPRDLHDGKTGCDYALKTERGVEKIYPNRIADDGHGSITQNDLIIGEFERVAVITIWII